MSWRYLAAATEAALKAGAIQKERFRQKIQIDLKGEIDLVTEVDRACEQAILATLHEWFPEHDIVAEESGIKRTGAREVWYVDPLDGTTNYAHGFPCFAPSIALTIDGEVVAGAVYDPLREELYTAERGAGAHRNGRRLSVSATSELGDSLLLTGFPYDSREQPELRARLINRFIGLARGIRRDGAASLDLCYVAAGCADGFFEEILKPWDIMAGQIMIEEAGGRNSRFDGAPMGTRADEVIATNGRIHEAMVRVLDKERIPAGVAE